MIDMRGWKSKTVDVLKDVHLDPRNVRLDLESNAPEADIMLDLFQNEKALSLVEAIAKVGYFTHEVPIVVNRDGKLIVVEGNRRLAALKAIQNPYLVADFQSRVTALAKDIPDRDALRKIEVKVAPSQADADQLIATLHTGAQRRPWGPARQAAFFQAQIDGGQTYTDLLAHYPTVDVDKFVLRSLILNRFKKVKYPTPELTDFVIHRTKGRPDHTTTAVEPLARRTRGRPSSPRPTHPRPTPPRRDPDGSNAGHHDQGADVPHRPQLAARRPHLPARNAGARPHDRFVPRRRHRCDRPNRRSTSLGDPPTS